MQAQEQPDGGIDSLEIVELAMRIEEALERPDRDRSLTTADRAELIDAIQEVLDSRRAGGNDEPGDDDPLAILVRKLGPKKPRGSSGATVPLR